MVIVFKLVGGNKRLQINNVGNVRIKLTRPIQGKIKQVSITHSKTGKWYVCFVCVDVPHQLIPKTNTSVGIDLGLTHLFTTNTGETIPNPRYLKGAVLELKQAQRKLSKRKRGSKRRGKARQQLAKKHEKVINVRKDYYYTIIANLLKTYDTIYIEDLNIKGMIEKFPDKRKSYTDVAWNTFTNMLIYKAESAGKEVVKVDPKNTSQLCSRCGELVPKQLHERWHSCPNCLLELDRDHNSAINIFNRGQALCLRIGEALVKPEPKTRELAGTG